MGAVQSIEEAVVAKLRDLPADKQQEVLDFATFLETKAVKEEPGPLTSLRGLWKGHGLSISAEDIDEARKEMWGNFPREHFFDDEPSEAKRRVEASFSTPTR